MPMARIMSFGYVSPITGPGVRFNEISQRLLEKLHSARGSQSEVLFQFPLLIFILQLTPSSRNAL